VTEPIVSREYVERKAEEAYALGKTECPFPQNSAAARDWHKLVSFLRANEKQREAA